MVEKVLFDGLNWKLLIPELRLEVESITVHSWVSFPNVVCTIFTGIELFDGLKISKFAISGCNSVPLAAAAHTLVQILWETPSLEIINSGPLSIEILYSGTGWSGSEQIV